MPGDVVAEELHPGRVVAVHSTRQLRLGRVPLLPPLERDMRRSVVHNCERRHPEVVPQPGPQPVLNDTKPTKVGNNQWEGYRSESSARGP